MLNAGEKTFVLTAAVAMEAVRYVRECRVLGED